MILLAWLTATTFYDFFFRGHRNEACWRYKGNDLILVTHEGLTTYHNGDRICVALPE